AVENGKIGGLACRGEMADQRVEARPPLGREDRGDGTVVGGVAAQPVDRLGRKGDERAASQQPCRLGDVLGSGGKFDGRQGGSARGGSPCIPSPCRVVAACRRLP